MSDIEKYNKNSFLKTFESLRPDLFFPEEWTEEQRAKASDLIRPQKN